MEKRTQPTAITNVAETSQSLSKRQKTECEAEDPGPPGPPAPAAAAAAAATAEGEPASTPAPQPAEPGTSKPPGVADSLGPFAAAPAADGMPPRQLGAYTQREQWLRNQELQGEISFAYLMNDGAEQHNKWLIELKNIYGRQLPNMPKEYVTRLVMDRRHRSVAIVKKNGAVVGGISYRAFHSQDFGEIAFCAITANEQVKGYGTRLMNHTKEYARTRDGLHYFLTYADNNAVGYFQKQGFSKEVSLPREQWFGYIKDYEGGTLMECRMHPQVNYADIPGLVQRQREALEKIISSRSLSYRVFAGPTFFQQRPPGSMARLQPEQIQGVMDAGFAAEAAQPPSYRLLGVPGSEDGVPSGEPLAAFIRMALKAIKENADSWPFHEPVDVRDVPDYLDVVKDPVDMTLMEKRLASGSYYLTLEIFNADVKRMLSNCRLYNAKETVYYKLAVKLEAWYDNYVRSRVAEI